MTADRPLRGPRRSVKEALQDRYDVGPELGRGGMATVYSAQDLRYDRPVALKVLLPELVETSAAERFLREIRAVSQLQHPHILPIFDSGRTDGHLWYTMPLVEGETLRQKLDREGPLPIHDCLRITEQVGSALTQAHKKKLVHRDIKPENILLSGGHAVIADFGVARALEESGGETLTKTGITIGTPAYMSPEQASGSKRIDHRSDLYSLACVLYEMLVGEPPFTGGTAQAVLAKHVQERPPSAEILRPAVPVPLSETVRHALAKIPADRYQTAEQLVEALHASAAVSTRQWRQQRALRRMGLGGLLIVGSIAVVALGIRFLLPESPNLDPNRVMVFPLVSVGGSENQEDGWDVALAIGTALEHVEPLRFEDGWLWLSDEMRGDPSLITQDLARQIAMNRGAERYVAGVIRFVADSVAVTLRLHESETDLILDQETAWGASESAIYQVGMRAFNSLLPHLLVPGREFDLSDLTTQETPARAFVIQGLRAYQESRYGEALARFQRALEEDPRQPMAAARGAASGVWVEGETGVALELSRIAMAHDSILPPRYRHFARGVEAFLSGRGNEALSSLDSALAIEPEWAEALALKGEVFYHLFPVPTSAEGPSQGVFHDFEARSVTAFQEAVRVDSSFTPPMIHLTAARLRAGDTEGAEHWIERLEARGAEEGRIKGLRLGLACVQNSAEDPGHWREAAEADPYLVLTIGHQLAVAGSQPACAEQAFRALVDRGGQTDNPYWWGGILGLQSVLLAQGRIEETGALLDSALAMGYSDARTLYLFDAPLSQRFHAVSEASEAVAREFLGERYAGLSPVNIWLIGIWFARRSEAERVTFVSSLLDSLWAGVGEGARSPNGLSLEVVRALSIGETERALDSLNALQPSAPLWEVFWALDEPRAIERILVARALLRDGRYPAAHDLASQCDHPGSIAFLAYLGPSLEIRKRAAEALGQTQLANEYRERLLQLGWPDGEVPMSLEGPIVPSTPTQEAP